MTLTLELPDDVMQKLASEAQTMQLSVEGLALLKLQRDFATDDTAAPSFDEAADYVLGKNAELYRRLA